MIDQDGEFSTLVVFESKQKKIYVMQRESRMQKVNRGKILGASLARKCATQATRATPGGSVRSTNSTIVRIEEAFGSGPPGISLYPLHPLIF